MENSGWQLKLKPWTSLPSRFLQGGGPLATIFGNLGLTNFKRAGCYVQQLPYGRNSFTGRFDLVIPEGKGTCSTKHALLAALAREEGLGVRLNVGIYEMNPTNTPGVGDVLKKHGLEGLPEAHCFLSYGDHWLDVTWPVDPSSKVKTRMFSFLHLEDIQPEQIGIYKTTLHKQWMRRWLDNKQLDMATDQLYRIREECIQALQNKPSA